MSRRKNGPGQISWPALASNVSQDQPTAYVLTQRIDIYNARVDKRRCCDPSTFLPTRYNLAKEGPDRRDCAEMRNQSETSMACKPGAIFALGDDSGNDEEQLEEVLDES